MSEMKSIDSLINYGVASCNLRQIDDFCSGRPPHDIPLLCVGVAVVNVEGAGWECHQYYM